MIFDDDFLLVVLICVVIVFLILVVNFFYQKYVERRMFLFAESWNEERKINKLNRKIEKELRNK